MQTGTENVTIKATCLGEKTYSVEWCVDDGELGIWSVNGIDCDLLKQSFMDDLVAQLLKNWEQDRLEYLASSAEADRMLMEIM